MNVSKDIARHEGEFEIVKGHTWMVHTHSVRFYAGVFLIAGTVMMMQILQSRLFSVTSWYHLSFLVISIAMFGLTLGALTVYQGNESHQRQNFGTLAGKACLGVSVFIFLALLVQLLVPLVSQSIFFTLAFLPIVAIPTAVPYYFAGIAITVSLTRTPFRVGRTYGVDLLGAGAGCLGALALMESVDTPTGLIFLSAVSALAALTFPANEDSPSFNILGKIFSLKKTAAAVSMGAVVIALINAGLSSPMLYPVWIKGEITLLDDIEYEEWNSISRITVHHERQDARPFLWGASDTTPDTLKTTYKALVIDGDAETPITKFDGVEFESLEYLAYDVTNIAYSLPDLNDAAIIGVGGGRDALSAKYFGVKNITAIDVNKVQIDLLSKNPDYTAYSNLNEQSGISFIHREARSWFRRNDKKFNIIQMSLIDTWAATGAGAFALSENGLYTVEAWSEFMSDLKPGGVFTVSRWSGDALNDTGRTLSLAMATLFNRGVEDARRHIFMASSGRLATLVLSADPFDEEQIRSLTSEAKAKNFNIIISPIVSEPEGILGTLLSAKSTQELRNIASKYAYDISPPTDMRPFFFNQARFTQPLEIIRNVFFVEHKSGVLFGQSKATFNLFLIIAFSAYMVVFVIIKPLSKTLEKYPRDFLVSSTGYFLLIGLGFMLIEISLLQALGVFLGHPSYGLGVLLFSLILSMGIGSLISDRLPLSNIPAQILWGAAIFAYAIFLGLNLGWIFDVYGQAALIGRAMVSVALIVPLGVLLGYGFPTGIRLVGRTHSRATAWLWGINGAAGVLGSALAIAFNIAFGIDKTLMIGGFCYAALAFVMLSLSRRMTRYAGANSA